jgi:hypothetical protein
MGTQSLTIQNKLLYALKINYKINTPTQKNNTKISTATPRNPLGPV